MTESSASTRNADLGQTIVDEINAVRTNPAGYIPRLQAWLDRFVSYKTIQLPSGERIETKEGQAVVREILWFLQSARPRAAIALSEKMSGVAQQLFDRTEGGDNSVMADIAVTLNRDFSSPQDIILQFLIDDGRTRRDRRRNILNPDFKIVGVAGDLEGQPGFAIAFAAEEMAIAEPVVRPAPLKLLDSEPATSPGSPEGSDFDPNAVAQSLLLEINRVRANPKSYIPILEAWRQRFVDDATLVLPSGRRYRTREGISAVNGAINILNLLAPVPPLTLSSGMSQSVRDRVTDSGATGETGHQGSDESGASDRLERYGTWQGRWAENLSYGKQTAEAIVTEWLIDDGIEDRRDRNNLLDPAFQKAGVSCASHSRYDSTCAIVFASQYEEKNED